MSNQGDRKRADLPMLYLNQIAYGKRPEYNRKRNFRKDAGIGRKTCKLTQWKVLMKIPIEIRTLIESGCSAHLVTINSDGSPQITLVWIGMDGDELVAGHLPKNQKVKNILRDPRVAVSLLADSKSEMNLREYAILYGEAYISEGGAAELLQKLAEVYIGKGVKFPPMDNPPPGYITHIRVNRIKGVGPWTGRPV